MTGLAVAVVCLAAVAYLLLRNADRWAWHPPRPLPDDFKAGLERMQRSVAQLGVSFAVLRPGLQRMGDAIALVGDTWALSLHQPLPEDPALCQFDGQPYPCSHRHRLTAQVAARRARLAQPVETVGTHR